MFILVPIQQYHPVTGQEDEVTVSLVSLDIGSVQSIDVDLETGHAIITYKSGQVVKTLTPFISIVTLCVNSSLVAFVDKTTANYFTPLKGLLKEKQI